MSTTDKIVMQCINGFFNMLEKFLCCIGLHDWRPHIADPNYKQCYNCGKEKYE